MFAQTIPGQSEVKPKPKDPRYKEAISIPGQEQAEPGAELLFTPNGQVDMQKYLEAREEYDAERNREKERSAESQFEDWSAREKMERFALQQFGIDEYSLATKPKHEHETPLRRFTVIFMISLPITMAASYGIFSAAKGSGGKTFNGPETAGMIALGALASGGIGYYDYRNVYGNKPLSNNSFRIQNNEFPISVKKSFAIDW